MSARKHENTTRKHETEETMLRIATPLDAELERIIHRVIGCCIEVPKTLGPGLVERVYQPTVALELEAAGIPFEREKRFPVRYRNRRLADHRVDFVVADHLLLELKAVDRLHPVHHAQVRSSLRVSKLRIGLLINFNVALLPQGIKRIVQ
jgi:GxxExxY protein